MGWVKEELARPEQSVEGIIVVGEADPKLRFAVATTPALRVMSYRIDFTLVPSGEIGSS
jgi:restriction system protein